MWLSSWSCGHTATWCDVVSAVVLVITSWFLGVSYRSWLPPPGHRSPYGLEALRAMIPIVGVVAPIVWMASK
jgi:hypothetical protein